MARLYVLSGADIGRTLDFERSIRIGRIAGCDLVLRDASISRSHARLERGSDGWEVIDEDSRNGVTLAGARVKRSGLADGQEFKLGEVLLRFREATVPALVPALAAPAPTPLLATVVRPTAPRAATAAESGLELEQADEIDLGAAPARKAAPAAGEGLREQRGRILQYHRTTESDSPLSVEFAQLPLWQRALVVTLAAALMAALAWGALLGSAFLRGKLAPSAVEATE